MRQANVLVAFLVLSSCSCTRRDRADDARQDVADAANAPIHLVPSAEATSGWWKLVASDHSFSVEFPQKNPVVTKHVVERYGDAVSAFMATYESASGPGYSIGWMEIPSQYTNVDPRRVVESFQQSGLQKSGQKFVRAKDTRVDGFTCRDQWTEQGGVSHHARTCMRSRLVVTLVTSAPTTTDGGEMSRFVESLKLGALDGPVPSTEAASPLHGFFCLDVTAGDHVEPRFSCRRMAGECEAMRPMVAEVMTQRLEVWHLDAGLLKIGSCSYSAVPAYCTVFEGRYWCGGTQEVCAQVAQRMRASQPDASIVSCAEMY